jgi:hypothetical protein
MRSTIRKKWKVVALGCCGVFLIGTLALMCRGEAVQKPAPSNPAELFKEMPGKATSVKCFYAEWHGLQSPGNISEQDLLTKRYDYCVTASYPLVLSIQLRDYFQQYTGQRVSTQGWHDCRMAVVFFEGESEIGRIVYPKDQPITVINGQAYARDFGLMRILLGLLPQDAYDEFMLANAEIQMRK